MSDDLSVLQSLFIHYLELLASSSALLLAINLLYTAYDFTNDFRSDTRMINTIRSSAIAVDYTPINSPDAISDYVAVTSSVLTESGKVILEDAKEDIL